MLNFWTLGKFLILQLHILGYKLQMNNMYLIGSLGGINEFIFIVNVNKEFILMVYIAFLLLWLLLILYPRVKWSPRYF